MLEDGVGEPLRQRGQAEESSRYVLSNDHRITKPGWKCEKPTLELIPGYAVVSSARLT